MANILISPSKYAQGAGEMRGCTGCTLLHVPGVADYVKRNPEAALTELKRLRDTL